MILKKALSVVLATALLAVSFAGCQNTDSSSSEAKSTATSSSEAEKTPTTDKEWNDAMLKKAMVSYGNTYLMRNAIKKAQSGETTTVAYIGGSITEGISAGADACYAKLSYNYFAKKFGKGDNVKYVNAGLSGTPSKLGVLRLNRDVLSKKPDVCFIEFAVNDGSDSEYQNAYESMVRTLLENNIAVVLFFSVAKDDHSAQDYMKQIGESYKLPMISYCDALRYMFKNKRLTWEKFSDDESHPNVYGHKLVASMIDYYFDNVLSQAEDKSYAMPEATVFSPREMNAKMVENTDITPSTLGSWGEGTETGGFKNGWYSNEKKGNKPIKFALKAKFIYLIYTGTNGNGYGKVHVKISADGKVLSEDDYDAVSSDGWGGAMVQNIVMDATVKDYTIELSMAKGSEDDDFDILGFGYTE